MQSELDRIAELKNDLIRLEDKVIQVARTLEKIATEAKGDSLSTEDPVESARHAGRSVGYSTSSLTIQQLVAELANLRKTV